MKDLAWKIAKSSFDNKTDLAGEPYISHIKRVTESVPKYDSDIEIVAILHDLLEDCPEWTEGALRHLFTKAIVDSIVALTRLPNQSYDDYITQVLSDEWAGIVKLQDLKDNMNITRLRELTDKDFKRLQKYHKAYLRIKNR